MLERLIGRLVDRLADRLAKRVLTQYYFRELHPSTLLLREAQAEAAAYVKEKMPGALYFLERDALLRYAVQRIQGPGLVLEFGVFGGKSIGSIARAVPGTVHGFDSFEGLPEDWSGNKDAKGQYSTRGRLPEVPPNVRLHKGWFTDTLPGFFAANAGPIAFLHVDCDLYSSTRTVLDHAVPRLRPGTVVVLDDYFNFPGWKQHEWKALQESVQATGLAYEYIGYARHQVALVITRGPGAAG